MKIRMPDYQNGKIYKLICSETGRIYVGSTVQPLNKRLWGHREKNNSCSSKDFFNPKIFLLQHYPCNSKQELELKEREYIKTIECVNIKIPERSKQQWYEDNKKKFSEQQKIYREKNKEKISEYYKQWHQENKVRNLAKKSEKFNCECGGKYSRDTRARHFRTKKHLNFIS